MKPGLRLETRTHPQRTRRTTIQDGDSVIWNNGANLPYLAFRRRNPHHTRMFVDGMDMVDFGITRRVHALKVMTSIASLLNMKLEVVESTDDRLIMVFHKR